MIVAVELGYCDINNSREGAGKVGETRREDVGAQQLSTEVQK